MRCSYCSYRSGSDHDIIDCHNDAVIFYIKSVRLSCFHKIFSYLYKLRCEEHKISDETIVRIGSLTLLTEDDYLVYRVMEL